MNSSVLDRRASEDCHRSRTCRAHARATAGSFGQPRVGGREAGRPASFRAATSEPFLFNFSCVTAAHFSTSESHVGMSNASSPNALVAQPSEKETSFGFIQTSDGIEGP